MRFDSVRIWSATCPYMVRYNGHHFTLYTDHQPLMALFKEDQANRGVTRKLQRRGDVAIDCTYSRSQSATMSGNETQVASFPGFVRLGTS